jgi:hypothetical protein
MADKVYFRDQEGALFSVAPNDIAGAEKMGLVKASEAEIKAGMARKEAATLSGQAKTLGENVAVGAVDALTAIPRAGSALLSHAQGTEDPLADFTGRNFMETAAYTAGGSGIQGVKESKAYEAAARARSAENPLTAGAGYIGGTILGAGALSAAGRGAGAAVTSRLGGGALARITGAGVAGALEGAPLNLVAQQDAAHIEQRKLTGEQAVSALGVGAMLGAGVGGGVKSFGEAFGAAKGRVGQYLTRGAGVEGAEAAAGERTAVQKILRTGDADLSKSIGATVGAEALPEAAGYARDAVKGRSLATIRGELHDTAAREMAAATNDSLRAVQRIEDKVTNRGWKLSQIEAHSGTFSADALEQTQARAAAIRADVHETIAELGKDAPKTLKGLAAQLDKNEFVIRNATSPAKANLAMDQIRRDLLRTNGAFDTMARRAENVDAADMARVLTQKTGEHYETAQKFLMDKATWGAQGEAQEAVNTAYADLIRAKRNAIPAFTQDVRGAEYMGAGIARDQAIAHEGKILGTVRNLGKAEGAVGQRAMDEGLTAMKNFTDAAQKYGLDAGDKAAVANAKKALATFESKLTDVTRKTAAIEQAETWLGRSKETQGLLAPAAVGSFIAGPIGAAAGTAATFIGNSPQALAKRLMIEEAAGRAQRVVGSSLDGFFDSARAATQRVGDVVKRTPVVAPAIPTALELFQGKHATPELAYRKRVEDLQVAGANFGQQIRDGANRTFGTLAADDPHAVNAAVVAGSKGVQALLSALPVGTVDPKSLTPNASRPTPTRLEIQQFADVWTAVMKPMDVVKQIPNGTVTVPQMNAIRQTYPVLYGWLRGEVLDRLAKMDEDGVQLPVHAIDTLDVLLDLGDAAGPIYSTAFAAKYGQQMGDAAAKARQPKPPKPSTKGSVGQRLAAGTSLSMMTGGS